MDKPKIDLQAQAHRHFARLAREPNFSLRSKATAADDAPGDWQVEQVNVDDQVTINPEQTSICRTVVLQSVTYINTETGEIVTMPVTPVP